MVLVSFVLFAMTQVGTLGQTYCNAASECSGGSIQAEKTYCRGSYACNTSSNSPGASDASTIYAYGASSFVNARSALQTRISCDGEQSCAYSHIKDMESRFQPIIDGYGAYSLMHANISANTGQTSENYEIELYGHYAGYGATIKCAERWFGSWVNYQCYITCAYTACYMLHCIGECRVSKVGAWAIDPIINSNNFQQLLDESENVFEYYPSTMTASNEAACNQQQNDMVFDDFQEQYGVIGPISINASSAGPVCCRGEQSCASATWPASNTSIVHNSSVVCSGYQSCKSATIDTPDNVYCEGESSCQYANIMNAQNLYCMAVSACQRSSYDDEYISVPNVICAATASCRSLKVNSSGKDLNVSLLGYWSGYDMSIYCMEGDHCRIECKGYLSCQDIEMQCDGFCEVECEDGDDCPQITSNNPTAAPTMEPTYPSLNPTSSPTEITNSPTLAPSGNPTVEPTYNPTLIPTVYPTRIPTRYPSPNPSATPSEIPSNPPTYVIGETTSGTNGDIENTQDINTNGGTMQSVWLLILAMAMLLCCT